MELSRTIEVLERGVAEGLHLGWQLAVRRRGEVVGEACGGEARPGVAMAADTLTLWMSAGKPLTAVAVGQQVAAGRLRLDQPVADVIPEFAAGGKGGVTVGHVLTHTGGFRQVSSNWSTAPWGEVIETICATPLEDGWVPGETAGYHVASGWYVLGELVRRVDPAGRAFDAYLREEVCEPLGMDDSWVGMPRRQFLAYNTRIGMAWHTDRDEPRVMPFPHAEAGCTLCRPGGNARGPARELALFYDKILAGGVVPESFTQRQRVGLKDKTFGSTIDWGYGFLMNDPNGRRVPYGYGPHASPETFGHSGNQSSCAFADPTRGLAVAWVTNGLPGELAHQRRQIEVNTAIYEDCGLARDADGPA